MRNNSVLIVDHHSDVLTFMESALVRHGYDVLSADSAASALNIVLQNPDLGLIISEDVLPKTSGLELVQAIKKSFPDIAVLLTTDDISEPPIPPIPYLRKPFTAQALVGRVGELLEGTQRAIQPVRDAVEQRSQITQQTAVQKSERGSLIKRSREFRWRRSPMQSRAHRPTILFVENDPICRYAVSHHLSRNGFDVLNASGYREASELWRDHCNRINIVLMAVNGADGLTLAKVFELDCPEKPIVLITDDDAALPYPVLQKPFDLDDLLANILRILEHQKPLPHWCAA